ncbi:MAG: hypothetical protein JKY44_09350 [Flavobacteriaceae bacterium]|nr:hypothetical protein [Flavobacteriaceae bacterium]
MNIERDKLFEIIQGKLPKNISFIDEAADVLDISYDAMYRRLNGKTTLSFTEAIQLAKRFKISINSLYSLDEDIFVLKRTNENTLQGTTQFFEQASNSIKIFAQFKRTELMYAAKDVPVYYLQENSLFTRFKLYVFSQGYKENDLSIKFKDFNPPISLINAATEYQNSYKNIHITELWNDATINSNLYQIYYFFESKLLDKEEALELCSGLMKTIKIIEKQAIEEICDGSENKEYKLYFNQFTTLNNSSLFKTEKIKILLIPYTQLSYIKIDDKKSCEESDLFFERQKQLSKKISGEGEIDRNLFFNSMYEKIDQLKQQIEVKSKITFL